MIRGITLVITGIAQCGIDLFKIRAARRSDAADFMLPR
jgi:hypothetical protein